MQRRSAAQVVPFRGSMAETTCVVCEASGVTILAMGRNDNGAIERAYCGIECARREGWPWLNGDGWRRAS